MLPLRASLNSFGIRFFVFLAFICAHSFAQIQPEKNYHRAVEKLLSSGDEALSNDNVEKAIQFYTDGVTKIASLKDYATDWSNLVTVISLYTNFGTALSSLGKNEEALEKYAMALRLYKDMIDRDSSRKKGLLHDQINSDSGNDLSIGDLSGIASQAAFFSGMVYQDMNRIQEAIDAYKFSNYLDSRHWASMANIGSIFQDNLKNYREALWAYNKAYSILTNSVETPTDPPPEPRFILSQLQYRIGVCLSTDLARNVCVLNKNISDQESTNLLQDDEKDKDHAPKDNLSVVDCKEMAAHAFSLAIKYDPDNSQAARHMLATITADGTVRRASNEYVKYLFDEYAQNFEQSLVQELRYNGYQRLRQAFDHAFGGQENVPLFKIVIDAGCGTGLVGEQFRNVSDTLIGVDLSETIIQQALLARPHLYDEVVAGDVTDVIRDKEPVNLIVAGDSFIYFGDLDPLFDSVCYGLEASGYIAFTLENVRNVDEAVLIETKPDWRWQLTASGRFAHRKEYVIEAAKHKGLDIVHYESLDGFRYEHGEPVRGHIFILSKQYPPNNTNKDKEL